MYPYSCYHQWPSATPCYWMNNWSYGWNPYMYNWSNRSDNPQGSITLQDYGANPFVVNMEQAARQNRNYRTALWTGQHFQVTLMSINAGDDIGLEVHPTTDQFIRIEEGQGYVQMGDRKDSLDYQTMAKSGDAIMVPAGKWHNITNTGSSPLKVSVIYAPPEHPFGTVHETKAAAQESE